MTAAPVVIELSESGVPIIVALVGAGGVVAGALFAFFGARASARASIDKRIDDRVAQELKSAWTRIDALEEKQKTHIIQMSAVARILRAIADQWPHEHAPRLDPRDIALIEDTIPSHWIYPKDT